MLCINLLKPAFHFCLVCGFYGPPYLQLDGQIVIAVLNRE